MGPSQRYGPTPFRHNIRIGMILMPTLVTLIGFGGKLTAAIIMIGAMVAYMMDALRYREGALGAIWITLGLGNLSMFVSEASFGGGNPLLLSAAVSFGSGSTLFLVGVWATLQFKWIQLRYPVVCTALERLLFAGTLPVAAMILTWATLIAVGPSNAPFYQAVLLSGLYYALATPVEASFELRSPGREEKGANGRHVKAVPEEARVQGSLEGCVGAALTVALPPLLYLVAHRHVIAQSQHLWGLLLLASAPLVLLTVLQEGLWWLPLSGRQREAVRKAVLLGAVLAALGSLEGRIIFRAFGQYIMLHPPWSYLVVTIALYGSAALLAMHFAGMLTETMQGSFASTVAGSLLIVCACAGAFAAGLPLLVMPAPLVAASGLVLWFESGQLRDYAIFFAGAMLTAAWFLNHHFVFLEVHLAHMSLQSLVKLLMAGIVIAATIPGIIYSQSVSPAINATLLAGQAVVVAALEENLYGGVHDDEDEHIYPAAFVVLTSLVGFYVVSRLQLNAKVGPAAAWLTKCIYVAKLSVLIIPEARLTIPVLLVTLAVTPPFLLQMTPLDPALGPRGAGRTPQLPPWQGMVQAGGVIASVFHARFALFEVLQRLHGGRPTEALLLGCLLLGAAAGCAPIALLQYGQAQGARRALALTAALGMLLVMLRPPLPTKGGAGCPPLPFGLCPRLWDERHVPGMEEDDAAMYGEALARRRHWPLWLVIGAVAAGLWAATGSQSRRRGVASSLMVAVIGGAFMGAYLMWEFFPGQPALQMLVFGATTLVAVFLVLLQQPSRESATWLPYLAAVWALMLPITSFVQAALDLPPVPGDLQRLYSQSHLALDAERLAAQRGAVLAIWAAEALLMALVLKLKVSSTLADSEAPPVPGTYKGSAGGFGDQGGFLGFCLPNGAMLGSAIGMKGAGGAAMHQLAAQGLGWAPTVGNLSTLLCFVLALALNAQLNEAADEAILVLAPMLLLMNQDPLVFRSLTVRRRYAPLVLGLTACLTFSAVTGAFQKAGTAAERSPFVVEQRQPSGMWLLIKNLALLALALPNHILFLRYVWSRKGALAAILVGLSPLSTLAALLTDLQSIRLLSGLAIAMAAVQLIHMRSVRQEGLRII
ncbi:hypothetical protein CVIRNUC_001488 [Coccomyxa viridis]|uniref:No exine formation 1 n=1 Tax=Coccomyxa viridis TaxID=1274662 RepID=A0AAV1HXM6_9CHLO|nr:hypothetical protein CVIRNUC_001488 [Coccomyxa viridis]